MDNEITPTNQSEIPPQEPGTPAAEPQNQHDENSIAPRGAFVFVLLMITFYIGYWFLTWFEIFVLRGA